jgi:hypothetical protein
VTGYVPPGWPAGVQPPGTPEFEQTAVSWLLQVVPPDYMLHGVLKRHPIALATLARHHLTACVDGARNGYRSARSELRHQLPPSAVEGVLSAYRSEGMRLAESARAADLIERALRGEVFVRQMNGGARSARPSAGPSRSAGTTSPAREVRQGGQAEPPQRTQPPAGASARSRPAADRRAPVQLERPRSSGRDRAKPS